MKQLFYYFLFFIGSIFSSEAQRVSTSTRVITKFSVKAVDDKTQKELPAQFIISLKKAQKTYKVANQVGKEPFNFNLVEADTISITSKMAGYYSYDELLLALCDTCSEYQHIVTMEKIEDVSFTNLQVNDVRTLDKIYFAQSSFILTSDSYPQLTKLYQALQGNSALKLEISGHTDNVGNAKLNQLLSENRARVICNYLVGKGIDSNRLRFVGYGSSHPVAPNDTEENKSQNRRVECLVIAK